MTHVLGIDTVGSGIKGAPVDLEIGDFAAERLRIDTPSTSTPKNVAKVVAEIIVHFQDTNGLSSKRQLLPAGGRSGKAARK